MCIATRAVAKLAVHDINAQMEQVVRFTRIPVTILGRIVVQPVSDPEQEYSLGKSYPA